MNTTKRSLLAGVGVAATAGCLSADGQTTPSDDDDPIPTDLDTLAQLIFEQTNERREENNLTTTTRSAELDAPAKQYSKRMVEEEFFSHTSPDGEGIGDRLPCAAGGENLNEGYRNRTMEYANGDMIAALTESQMARYTVKSWMLSERHRENILTEDWSEQGVGVAVDGSGDRFRFLVTQLFCD